MNLFAGICLLGAIVAAIVGVAHLYIADDVGGDTLWKCLFIWALLLALSFLPWGSIVGGPTIRGRSE